MPLFSTRIASAAAVALLATLLATLGPAPAHSRLLLETAVLSVAPDGTVMPCDYGTGNQSNNNRVCDDNPAVRCNYRTCFGDDSLIEKCIVPSGWSPIDDDSLPDGAECEILTTEGGGTPQTTGATANPPEEEAVTPAGGATAAASEGTLAPAGTTLVCGDYGVGQGSSDNEITNCPEDPSDRCLFRTCLDDPTVTQKCTGLPADFSVIEDETLPADVECVILQNEEAAPDTPAPSIPMQGGTAPTTAETPAAGGTAPTTAEMPAAGGTAPTTAETPAAGGTAPTTTTTPAAGAGASEETAAAPVGDRSVQTSGAHTLASGSVAMLSAFAAVAAGAVM